MRLRSPPRRPRPLLPPLALLALGAAACFEGATLEARLEAPAVELSARDAMKELRFVAAAVTSAPVAAGEVQVVVRGDDAGASRAGQVRVTVGRGVRLMDDPSPRDEVVAIDALEPVAIAKDALAGCSGACRQPFVVVFAAEDLPRDVTVSVPVILEAQLLYEGVLAPPAADSLTLTLESER
jgi:hypothetical protein